jgi:hypothetical protein
MRIARDYPSISVQLEQSRRLLRLALDGSMADLNAALAEEQRLEQERDRQYWEPLRAKLQELRLNRPRGA